MESYGCLGIEGSDFIDQPATVVVGGRDGGFYDMSKKIICKERLLCTTDHLGDLSVCDIASS